MKIAALLLSALLAVPAFSAPAAAQDSYTLSLNLMIPPIHNRWHHALKPWADELNKRSGGRIVIEPYFAEALSKAADSYESVKTGIADLAEFCYDMSPGQFPYHERAMTLVRPDRSLDNPGVLLAEMEAAFPQVMQEVAGVKVLFSHVVNVGMLVGSKEPITSIADFKGKKINIDGDAQASHKVRSLGASVVNIPTSDLFMSLQQGVVDGTTCDFEILVSRRFGDVIKHMALINTAASCFTVAMNEDLYNGMPDDLKKIVDEVSAEYGTKKFNEFWAEGQYTSMQTWMKDMGGKVHLMSDADYQNAVEFAKPAMVEWIEVVNKAGLPGKELEAKFREVEEKYTTPWKDSKVMKIVSAQ